MDKVLPNPSKSCSKQGCSGDRFHNDLASTRCQRCQRCQRDVNEMSTSPQDVHGKSTNAHPCTFGSVHYGRTHGHCMDMAQRKSGSCLMYLLKLNQPTQTEFAETPIEVYQININQGTKPDCPHHVRHNAQVCRLRQSQRGGHRDQQMRTMQVTSVLQ